MGLFGIHIHCLKNSKGQTIYKGQNPFTGFNVSVTPLTNVVDIYDPTGYDSREPLRHHLR